MPVPPLVCKELPLENFNGSSFPGIFKHSQSKAASDPSDGADEGADRPELRRRRRRRFSFSADSWSLGPVDDAGFPFDDDDDDAFCFCCFFLGAISGCLREFRKGKFGGATSAPASLDTFLRTSANATSFSDSLSLSTFSSFFASSSSTSSFLTASSSNIGLGEAVWAHIGLLLVIGLGEKIGASFCGSVKGLGLIIISPAKKRSPKMATASFTERKGREVSMVERRLSGSGAWGNKRQEGFVLLVLQEVDNSTNMHGFVKVETSGSNM
ncbi:tetratricopeptide repeat protein [Striga asiatica]|uniref:Tetratricopeptide repeat protein n=1 Tax=Striga asiatica TaxID=4170 RepID=A0A5A7Q468_STRAF|nr:tetratricopeptide repeat protein [Striga asiatica]